MIGARPAGRARNNRKNKIVLDRTSDDRPVGAESFPRREANTSKCDESPVPAHERPRRALSAPVRFAIVRPVATFGAFLEQLCPLVGHRSGPGRGRAGHRYVLSPCRRRRLCHRRCRRARGRPARQGSRSGLVAPSACVTGLKHEMLRTDHRFKVRPAQRALWRLFSPWSHKVTSNRTVTMNEVTRDAGEPRASGGRTGGALYAD